MDQQKARHEINHPTEKGHDIGTTIENVVDIIYIYIKQNLKLFQTTLWGKISYISPSF